MLASPILSVCPILLNSCKDRHNKWPSVTFLVPTTISNLWKKCCFFFKLIQGIKITVASNFYTLDSYLYQGSRKKNITSSVQRVSLYICSIFSCVHTLKVLGKNRFSYSLFIVYRFCFLLYVYIVFCYCFCFVVYFLFLFLFLCFSFSKNIAQLVLIISLGDNSIWETSMRHTNNLISYKMYQHKHCLIQLYIYIYIYIYMPEARDDKEGWRERVRDIRADGITWWWWWYIYI